MGPFHKAHLVGVFAKDELRFVYYPAAASMEGGVPIAIPLPEDKMKAEQAKVAQEEKEVRAAFDKATRGNGIQTSFVSEQGDVNAILLREARAADLVVIGKRGRIQPDASRRAGPTTESLIHDALRPVLVVPAQARTEGPLLLAYDDSKGVQRVLPAVVDATPVLGGEITVVTVDDKPQRAAALQAAVLPYFQAHGMKVKFTVEHGKPAEAILRAAEGNRAGTIAMGAFNRNPVYELFFGSNTLAVLERAPCPVLLTS
jgi:nucleotide-binding universal stress UspA family protein